MNSFFLQLDLQMAETRDIISRSAAEIDRLHQQDGISFEEWEKTWLLAKKRLFADSLSPECPICMNSMNRAQHPTKQSKKTMKRSHVDIRPEFNASTNVFSKRCSRKPSCNAPSPIVKDVQCEVRKLTLLDCAHVFHSTCLSMFEHLDLNIFHHVCPVCRSNYKRIEVDEILYLD